MAPESEDLVMDSPQNQKIKCPITGKEIVDAYKNPLCDHVYEKEAIIQYCINKGRQAKKWVNSIIKEKNSKLSFSV